jgi:hypothetical protein
VSVGLPTVCALVGAEVIGFNSWRRLLSQDALRRADLAAYALFRGQQPLIDSHRRRAGPAG